MTLKQTLAVASEGYVPMQSSVHHGQNSTHNNLMFSEQSKDSAENRIQDAREP